MFAPLLLLLTAALHESPQADRLSTASQLTSGIDAIAQKHWQANQVEPAPLADDTTFLRRITLDLAGRVPTYQEATSFAADLSPDKRARVVRRLMEGPEYALHLGRVLDEMIQERFAGKTEFLEYARSAVAEHKSWDRIFREIMLGPWDSKDQKRAEQFLARRVRNLDDLTNDTSRVFFGVNVSCAKCHDHPLVPDWTQEHYYGMASFFNRTQEGSKGKRGADVMEADSGDVTFVSVKGQRRTARLMFLTGRVLDEPAAAPAKTVGAKKTKQKPAVGSVLYSRREQLVKVALDERKFFSRAIVNRLWANLMGRGLVQPVDQMHSANPPVIPGLLEWLAEDLASHGYDLDRVVAGIVSSRVYQLASTATSESGEPTDKEFARALLRPLTPHQYALSMVLAAGDGTFDQATAAEARARRYRDLEGQASRLTKPDLLDPRSDRFQSSAGEALFLSNNEEVQRLVMPSGKNLAARLAAMRDVHQLVSTAVWTVLSRPPEAEEGSYLARWIEKHPQDRPKACGELVWALLTSAEFRFNH
jgi:hypothetical protein